MITRALSNRAGAVVVSLTLWFATAPLLPGEAAMAQIVGARPQALSKATIQSFEADPHSLLRDYSAGGLPLSARVRALAVSDAGLVKILIALAREANDAQKAAIGAGLAEAAQVLARFDPAAAKDIKEQIAKSAIDILVTAFIAASSPSPLPIAEDDLVAGVGGPPGLPGALGGPSSSHIFGAPASASGPAGPTSLSGAPIFSGGRVGGGGLNAFTQFSVSPSRTSM